ncbi:hypothetical protein BDV25DRAFT_128653 [Aspergillus avenaceus]|uniref:Uncharacterized protein n=1 Tax=Aspergillus avenaceus TaxID=36643 RepID=A0A5N6TYW8_ASPAV|nr:hypothetical protein BDV25DRAFT_128653 [Aspergillus avenaceus]
MVYRGKPSPACEPCRSRRLKIATCQGPPLIGRWLNHIEGGIKLIEIRGAEQLCRPAGLELFTQLRLQIALGNVYKKVSTPSWLVDLSQLAVAYRGDTGDQVLDYFFRILVRLGNVIAMIKDNRFNDPALMLEQAIRLDAELVSWAMSVDRSWHYTVVKVHKADTEDDTYRYVYGDHYHIYPNSIVSMAWNNYRFTRIIIHGIIEYIYDVSAHSDEKVAAYKTTAMQSADLTRQLAEDICAGVPYHLGITGSADPMTLGIPFAGGVLRLMWPLFIASDCSGSSNRMRAWIATCLEKIGHGVGINMALTMAQILRDNMHLNWRNEGEPNIVKRPRRPYLVRNEA